MDGDDGFIVNNGIHKGKLQCKKGLLSQRMCDGGARVVLDWSARQGTYDDGVGITKVAKTYFYNVGISVGEDGKKGCFQGKVNTLVEITRRYAYGGGGGADMTMCQQGEGKGTMTPDQHRETTRER